MDFISVKQASEKWEISQRRIQKLCEDNRIEGVSKFGRSWLIPKTAQKPSDKRFKNKDVISDDVGNIYE